jgi:hypothetical protein
MPQESKPEQDSKGRFVTGNIGGGRPKGSRNKLGEAFTDALYKDFMEHGEAAIETMRANDPSGYVRVIANILPKDVRIEKSSLEALSDEQLSRIIDSIREADASTISAGHSRPEAGKAVTH